MASWQTLIQRVSHSVRASRASVASPLPLAPDVLPPPASVTPASLMEAPLPTSAPTPIPEPDLTPTGDTFCVCCLMTWEEYGDWHGVRPAGEPDFCDWHFARITAAIPDPDECQAVLFRLSLHGRTLA